MISARTPTSPAYPTLPHTQIIVLDNSAPNYTASLSHQLCWEHVLQAGQRDLDALQQTTPGWVIELAALDNTLDSSAGSRITSASAPGPASQRKHSEQPLSFISPSLVSPRYTAPGVKTWVYMARRPFHAGRLLSRALAASWPGVIRSAGYCWLASRHDRSGLWQSAGGAWQCEPAGLWAAAVDQPPADVHTTDSGWHPVWGDRCTQLVWTGIDMDVSACCFVRHHLALSSRMHARFSSHQSL
jgi:G3E family GTPase